MFPSRHLYKKYKSLNFGDAKQGQSMVLPDWLSIDFDLMVSFCFIHRFIPFEVTGRMLEPIPATYGSPAHHRALCEPLGVRYFTQGYLGGALKVFRHLPLQSTFHFLFAPGLEPRTLHSSAQSSRYRPWFDCFLWNLPSPQRYHVCHGVCCMSTWTCVCRWLCADWGNPEGCRCEGHIVSMVSIHL